MTKRNIALLCDTNSSTRATAASALCEGGYEVRGFPSATKLLEHYKNNLMLKHRAVLVTSRMMRAPEGVSTEEHINGYKLAGKAGSIDIPAVVYTMDGGGFTPELIKEELAPHNTKAEAFVFKETGFPDRPDEHGNFPKSEEDCFRETLDTAIQNVDGPLVTVSDSSAKSSDRTSSLTP